MRFSDTITEEQYNKLTSRSIAYERKPDHPDEIQSSINFNELHESIRKIVSNLPIVEFESSFFNDILDGDQQFYLMTYKEKIFLIDTQGFTYARYVIQLKDLVVLEKAKPEADTMLMKGHPGMVEEIIEMLKHIDVDGETMEYILDKTYMKGQMLRQLFLKAHKDIVRDLSSERKQREGTF
tara:strand:- start:958 stop:1500 length:543 start_codon:yes stop_codon:yes gene_type:complete